ncbi:inositol monophosphatase [Desulfuromonas versatilis]|uniref:Inositol-1-monophosphatase n=1 Tax=Desulfuromonas versatilis TaxID=2802975 RepID=A0ABM8HVL3_9BACT|nr:inositol monophosphatase family protein [Desulfuromonas versatilis]BCR04583.1 inositol monophosphatase [Desulfuromonas versatilis]
MLNIAIHAAIAGGKVLMQKFGRTLSVAHKGEVDLVTEADRASEDAVVAILRGTFPRHDILAEEADHGRRDSRYRWIIDPLDGTTNYAHGFPWFAVSIALEVDDEITLGVVYNPAHREMFVAERGGGAFLNDVQIRVSRVSRLDQALLATGFPYDRKSSSVNNYDHFVNFQQSAQACRRAGAASLDLAYTAAGRLDGYWEMKLKPWDVAAGQLLVAEAGGMVSDFDGQSFDPYGRECLASNGLIHAEMVAVLQGGKRPR